MDTVNRAVQALRRLNLPGSDVGSEPDYRFSLANERTFLAWVRTALATMAAAVAVVQLVSSGPVHEFRRELGALLAGFAILISVSAYPRWAANQRAMRLDAPLPQPRLLSALALVLVAMGIGTLALVVVG